MPKPPTIARLEAMGVEGVNVTCRDCRRLTSLPFNAIALPDETLCLEIVKLRRFRCEGCGSRKAVVTPDWRGLPHLSSPGRARFRFAHHSKHVRGVGSIDPARGTAASVIFFMILARPNRSRLIVNACLTPADRHGERNFTRRRNSRPRSGGCSSQKACASFAHRTLRRTC